MSEGSALSQRTVYNFTARERTLWSYKRKHTYMNTHSVTSVMENPGQISYRTIANY